MELPKQPSDPANTAAVRSTQNESDKAALIESWAWEEARGLNNPTL